MATKKGRFVVGPTSPPVPQQLVIAQCAIQTNRNLIYPNRVNASGIQPHEACVATHAPVFYNSESLHSNRLNEDVLEVSGCASIINKTVNKFVNPNTGPDYELIERIRGTKEKERTLYKPRFVGISQATVSDGAGVVQSPEAMGRFAVAIGGLVSVVFSPIDKVTKKDLKIGDYLYITGGLGSGRASVGGLTISGAPKDFLCPMLANSEHPEYPNGSPARHLDVKNSAPPPVSYKVLIEGQAIGRIFEFGPGENEVQVLLC